MTRDEYEAQRRRLDEELRAAIELAEEGHRARVKALEHSWQSATSGVPVPMAAAKPRRRWQPGELYEEVLGLLPQLPEVFSKDDLAPLFADPPDRTSLFRALQELTLAGVLRQERRGQGRHATTYRRRARMQSP